MESYPKLPEIALIEFRQGGWAALRAFELRNASVELVSIEHARYQCPVISVFGRHEGRTCTCRSEFRAERGWIYWAAGAVWHDNGQYADYTYRWRGVPADLWPPSSQPTMSEAALEHVRKVESLDKERLQALQDDALRRASAK